jgi:hypothetical protein
VLPFHKSPCLNLVVGGSVEYRGVDLASCILNSVLFSRVAAALLLSMHSFMIFNALATPIVSQEPRAGETNLKSPFSHRRECTSPVTISNSGVLVELETSPVTHSRSLITYSIGLLPSEWQKHPYLPGLRASLMKHIAFSRSSFQNASGVVASSGNLRDNPTTAICSTISSLSR